VVIKALSLARELQAVCCFKSGSEDAGGYAIRELVLVEVVDAVYLSLLDFLDSSAGLLFKLASFRNVSLQFL